MIHSLWTTDYKIEFTLDSLQIKYEFLIRQRTFHFVEERSKSISWLILDNHDLPQSYLIIRLNQTIFRLDVINNRHSQDWYSLAQS